MQPTYKIHPAIGIARLGNSQEFYLAPEKTGGLPIQCDQKGTVDDPEQPVTRFKDCEQRIKRQGARFRVFVYDDNTPGGRELRIGDTVEIYNPTSGQLFQGPLVDIQWTVHLANKKASWYEFKETAGEHGYSPKHKLRNARIRKANSRQKLIIDPGPQTVSVRQIAVTGQATPPNAAEFALGKNPGYPQSFPPPLTPNSITTLGGIMAYPQENFARLVVLGGYGSSGSVKRGLGQPVIRHYANNDGWFDDTSDGPVTAQLVVNVTSVDGRTLPSSSQQPQNFGLDESSWVIVGYPRYVPEIVDIVTVDDVVYDLSLRYFAHDTYIYGIPPFRCAEAPPPDLLEWRKQAQWNTGYYPHFWRDIWPILSRPFYYQFLMDFDALTGGDPHEIAPGSSGNMDPNQISIPPFHGEDPEERRIRARQRQFVYHMLRQPGGENRLEVPASRTGPQGRPYAMPYLCGDNPLSNTAPSKFLRLTDTQLFLLRQWAEGKFINERLEKMPPQPQQPGVELDRGSLGNLLGGAFCPGGECSWIIRNPAIYSGPYRIKQASYTPGGLSHPAVVGGNITPARLTAGLEPGDLTKYDAVPWQADFNECSTQKIDITYEEWNKIYPPSTGDPAVPVQQLTYWWPAHRPMMANASINGPMVPWSPTPQNKEGDLQMVTAWTGLGFVLRVPGVVAGDSQPMFVNVPDGKADELSPPSSPSSASSPPKSK